MIVRDVATGELKVFVSREEFLGWLERWKQKPETIAMFKQFEAERKANIAKIMADIKARKK